jgi:outer membrane protein assembly factor BamB
LSAVDQQKIRRTRTGLIAHDAARAQPGYTLFTPMYGDGTVYLLDMYGKVAHGWRLPYRPGSTATWSPTGASSGKSGIRTTTTTRGGSVTARRVDTRQHRRRDGGWQYRRALPQHLDRRHDRARHGKDRLGAQQPTARPAARPRPLDNGNLLIFDNGTHRRDHPATFSRVIEVDRRTNTIVWQYADQSLFEFFSPYISGAQRLANGNTLISEGVHGRLFEVTREGEVVWEFVSPHFFDEPSGPDLNNWVFPAFRLYPRGDRRRPHGVTTAAASCSRRGAAGACRAA